MRIPKKGEKVFILNDALYSREAATYPCIVKNFSLDTALIKPYYGRSEIKVFLKDLDYVDLEILGSEEKKMLIEKWVKPDLLSTYEGYIKELSLLNRLLKIYPDITFWRDFHPGYKIMSLVWWFGKGKKDLILAYNSFTLHLTTTQKVINLQSEKIGEDVKISKKNEKFSDLFP